MGHLVAIDPVRRASSVWLAHELLTKLDRDAALPGANGIVVHAGWVYVTNTERAQLLRCPLAGPLPRTRTEVVAERLAGDDLDIDGHAQLTRRRSPAGPARPPHRRSLTVPAPDLNRLL
jgi:hypothetical protein